MKRLAFWAELVLGVVMGAIKDEWVSDDGSIRLIHGDSMEVLPTLEACSVDSIVCDPPYGISFMNSGWDKPDVESWGYWAGSGRRPTNGESIAFQAWCKAWAVEALRVAKPGAHLLAFGGTRTFHRLACALEDAGWEIRDCLMWVYGSGFPKSLDVGKQLLPASKRAGSMGNLPETAGFGTSLKPSYEPIILARKPLSGTVAANVLEHGTGALNIDGCRVGMNGEKPPTGSGNRTSSDIYAQDNYTKNSMNNGGNVTPSSGRWPANLIHDGSEEVVGLFPEQAGGVFVKPYKRESHDYYSGSWPDSYGGGHDNGGSAARFFYCAKADASERNGSKHPTVKPLALMRYLCRLITPPGGLILDPFLGSGTTAQAAYDENFRCLGIEREPRDADGPDYFGDAVRRLECAGERYALLDRRSCG